MHGSFPLGNGDIGANVWVEGDGDLVFYISKTDAWVFPEDPEKTFPNGDFQGRLYKVGRVRVKLEPNPFRSGMRFRQRLILAEGAIEVLAGDGDHAVSLRLFIDANHPVLRLEVEARGELTCGVELESWRAEDCVVLEDDALIWYYRNTRSPWALMMDAQGLGEYRQTHQLVDPILHRTFGAMARGAGFVPDGERGLRSSGPRKHYELRIHVLAEVADEATTFIDRLRGQADQTDAVPLPSAKAAHDAYWADFFSRSYVELTDGGETARLINEGHVLQRFINAAGGRGKSPIKFNGSIFTVDGTDGTPGAKPSPDYRRWQGSYWFQNTRHWVWPMLASGDFDLMQPFFDLYIGHLDLRVASSRVRFPPGGAYYPETMTVFGLHPHGEWQQFGGTKESPSWTWKHLTASLELLAIAIAYYEYRLEQEFLEKRLLPLAHAVLLFWDENFPRKNGRLYLENLQAMETWVNVNDPLPDVAGLHHCLDRLLALPRGSVPPELRREWTRLAAELPEVPLATDERGTYVLPYASEARDFCHLNGEKVETCAIFPFPLFRVGKEQVDIGRATFERANARGFFSEALRGGNIGWIWDPITAARLGLTETAAALVAERFSHKSDGLDCEHRKIAEPLRFPGFYGPNMDWVPDQDHPSVAVNALQEMLLQAEGDTIWLLPAWPREWDVRFRLHAPKCTVVEVVFAEGRITHLAVTPTERRADIVPMQGLELPPPCVPASRGQT
jgi:hypothetical protein